MSVWAGMEIQKSFQGPHPLTRMYGCFITGIFRRCVDLQVHGKYPDIAPVGGGFGGYTYESAGLIVTWEVYQQYGDVQVIKDNYEAMKAFMDYSARINVDGNLTGGVMTLGDWLSPDETDLDLICYAFYGYNARIMSKMAAAIGENEDAAAYSNLYKELKAYWNNRFVDPKTGKNSG